MGAFKIAMLFRKSGISKNAFTYPSTHRTGLAQPKQAKHKVG
jgi:hypothetical protein